MVYPSPTPPAPQTVALQPPSVYPPKNASPEELKTFLDNLAHTIPPCSTCGSKSHPPNFCIQTQAAHNTRFLSILEDIPAKEQWARHALRNGLPLNGARLCPAHVRKVNEILRARREPFNPHGMIPGSKEGVVTRTALLPICAQCFRFGTMPTHGQPTPQLDTCVCATGIVSSECGLCALEGVEKAWLLTVKSRITAPGKEGEKERELHVSCACRRMDMLANARKCAGCEGMVTVPATNFAGESLAFNGGSTLQAVLRGENVATGQVRLPGQQHASNPSATPASEDTEMTDAQGQ